MQSLYEGILSQARDSEELEIPLLLQHEINREFQVEEGEDDIVTRASLSNGTLILQVDGGALNKKPWTSRVDSGFNSRTDLAIRNVVGTSKKIKKIHLQLDSRSNMTPRAIHIADGTRDKGVRDWKLTSTIPSRSVLYLYGENRGTHFRDWKLECEGPQDDAFIMVYGGLGSFYMEDMDLKSDRIILYGGHGYLKNCQLQASHSVELTCVAGIHKYLVPEAVKYIGISDDGIIRSHGVYSDPSKMKKLETQYRIEDIIAETSILESLHPRTPRLIFSDLARRQLISLMFVRDPQDFAKLYDPGNYVTLADGWYMSSVII